MTDELQDQWHRAVCTELEARVKARTFLVWVKVSPGETDADFAGTPTEIDASAWDTVSESAEQWLGALRPGKTGADDLPAHELRLAHVVIELTAHPKNTKRHGTGPLIGNPYPGVVSFTGSHSTGPAEPFKDEG